MKYVRLYSNTLMVFSDTFQHSDMVRGSDGRPVISAGFVRQTEEGPVAYGASESLRLGSLPGEDTPLLREFLWHNEIAQTRAQKKSQ